MFSGDNYEFATHRKDNAFDLDKFPNSHYNSAHMDSVGFIMQKNITLSADEELIKAARERARKEHSSLNAEFRHWLRLFVREKDRVQSYRRLMDDLSEVDAGGRFSRDEANER